MDVLLIQPRHVYAPERPDVGHIYMPTSLLTAAARLLRAGQNVSLIDENLSRCTQLLPVTGINLVGAPYVPRAIEFVGRMSRWQPEGTLLLGGQVVSGFSEDQFRRLFGVMGVNGNRDSDLASAVGIGPGALPAPELVSLVPAFQLLADDVMERYLAREFSFYLSQGCRYSCSFCAAVRTSRDPTTGKTSPVREIYRDLSIVDADMRYLVERALRLGKSELNIYLSNLDLFQTPSKLREFARVMQGIKCAFPGCRLRMRGLSNVNSFSQVHETDSDLIEELVDAGLTRVGFGVDGATEHVWRAVRKPHGDYSCTDAIRICFETYGIVPEALMVFGHDCVDDGESMRLAGELVRALWEKYGAHPRPHVSKGIVPGNDGWRDPKNREIVDRLVTTPSLFQVLDFTSLPSALTHPDAAFRRIVTRYYVEICEMADTVTQYVLPEESGLSAVELEHVRSFNQGRYDV